MQIIVLDADRLLDYKLEKHLNSNNIGYFQTASADKALKTYIEDAGVDALVVLQLEDPSAYLLRLFSKFHSLDPTFPVLCVFANPTVLQRFDSRLEELNIVCREFEAGEPKLAAVLNALVRDVDHKRQAHRVTCRLQGVLYEHDERDVRGSDDCKMVSIVSMSSNGAYAASADFVTEVGKTYLFEITFPDFIFVVKGAVAYVGEADSSRPRGFALRFLEMSQAPQQLLKYMVEQELVDSILKKQGVL